MQWCKGWTVVDTIVFYPDAPFKASLASPQLLMTHQLCSSSGNVLGCGEPPCPQEACSQWLDDKDPVCATGIKEGPGPKNSLQFLSLSLFLKVISTQPVCLEFTTPRLRVAGAHQMPLPFTSCSVLLPTTQTVMGEGCCRIKKKIGVTSGDQSLTSLPQKTW